MIQINIKMPKCCDECFALDDHGDYPFCLISQDQRGYTFNTREKRMPTCPLKSQEPRVMTLDEVLAHYSLPPVFPDDLGMQEDYYEDIQPLYFEFPHDCEDYWIVHWRGHSQVARYLDEWKYSYNKKWRCWTSRPTDEQREAIPWQD